ncbi:hypothetical protein CBN_1266 [Clostridium botulinum NCTC 2916]|uniref:Uncharacterized protein n=1 Tax=Clostridium botulinum (strain Kyoto / Type A2) TaxID=536232 RepID=C1FKR9_CLOBJ|nr:hypothetical protein CLM_1346 [Clostridium botulinum A2 str. Kyoto]EDT82474.1 hypothetical protein CBN_1266 [Clostridium botulinum NCTC 2916]
MIKRKIPKSFLSLLFNCLEDFLFLSSFMIWSRVFMEELNKWNIIKQ